MEFFSVILPVILLMMAASVFSGLNIAIMSIDLSGLERAAKLRNRKALRVLPLRRNVHLTLASILLANVAAAAALPLVLNTTFSGVTAGIITTLLLVTFGEIFPQAFFAKHALTLCAFFSLPIRVMILATYPISKPLQLLLDRLVGRHGIHLHTRNELGIIFNEHLDDTYKSELDEDEVEIMRGALALSEKRVRDIMKPIKKVFWLTPDSVIDAKLIDEIKLKGWSRIPVLNRELTVCFGVLLMKDMVDIDFDETPRPVHELPLYQSKPVGSMTALDTMFRTFIAAHTHLLPVEKDGKIVGIVTIEDLLEEILGHEILDESDQARTLAAKQSR